MKRILRGSLFVITLNALSGCAVPSNVPVNGLPDNNEFVSVNPGRSDWVDRQTGSGTERQFWYSMSNKEINELLPLEKNTTSILRVQSDASVGYVGAKYTRSTGQYVVVIDYSKYRDEITDKEKTPCLVGVGIRVRATITTKKSDLDLGSLFAIAFAAKSGFLSGNIEVIKIGVDSPHLKSAIPDFTEISDSSVQQAMQAVGAVRNRLYDDDTKLTPHVLAVKFPTKLQP